MSSPTSTERKKLLEKAFKMPTFQTIIARKSSITNAFVNALIPIVRPTPAEIEEALRILEMRPEDVRCAYCGDKSSEWDHLRPLVLRLRPTGHISEIANLVPSCGKCNQSKGNSDWRKWIRNVNATHSPARRGIPSTEERIERLEAYERWRSPTKIDFEAVVPSQDLELYWSMWSEIVSEMRRCQDFGDQIRQRIAETLLK